MHVLMTADKNLNNNVKELLYIKKQSQIIQYPDILADGKNTKPI